MKLRPNVIALLAGSLLAAVPQAHALNILLCNDDGFTAANLRALYQRLQAAGHKVIISASVDNQSGRGGYMSFLAPIPRIAATYVDPYSGSTVTPRAVKATYPNLAGQPGIGTDPNDSKIFYVNGSPVMACLYGMDVQSPKNFGGAPDLVISGPNEGNNLGHINASSGTVNNTYYAINRNLPAIAVSDSATTQVEFTALTPASRAWEVADIVVNLVKTLVDKKSEAGGKLMPQGVGLNVNIPEFSPGAGVTLPFKMTQMGQATGFAPAFYEDIGATPIGASFGIPAGRGLAGISLVTSGTTLPTGIVIPTDNSPASEGNVIAVKSGVSVSVIEGAPDARRSNVEAMKIKLNTLAR